MNNYVLLTDNTCDLDDSYYKEHNIPVIMLPYSIDDVVYGPQNTIPLKDFYNCMREGKMPTTMACNPDTYLKTFKEYLKEEFMSKLQQIEDIEIVGDPHLAAGSCIVETENGIVDGSAQTRIKEIEMALSGG